MLLTAACILNVPEELDGWVFLVWYSSLLHVEQLNELSTLSLCEWGSEKYTVSMFVGCNWI